MRNIRKIFFLMVLPLLFVACDTQPIKPDSSIIDTNQSAILDKDSVADETDEESETKTTANETATPTPAEKPTTANDNIAEGKALLEIIINGENLGAQLVDLKKDDVIVATSVFKDWRIKKDLWASQTDNVSLHSLAPHLQYTVDNNNAALTIAATPESFEPQVLQTQTQYNPVIPADAVHPTTWSSFVNYALNANFSQPKGFDSLNAPWEVGINAGQWFAFSNFNSNYLNTDQSFKTTRSTSYLQWEDMESHQKVTLGDFSVNTPTLSSSGNFGGILWQSNFRQYGQFQSMPSLGLDFNVETPSHAELYVNDVKTKEWDLQPGMVSLPSVLTSGQGNATLVLTDSFGRQQQISQPFYITQQLLKEGLHDFYYGLGAKHKFSNKMIDYGSNVLFGAHRYGFTDSLTAGAAFTVHKKVSTIGVSVTHSFLGNSLIDAAVAVSRQSSLSGYLGTASYQLNLQPINLSLNAGYMSQQFGNLNIDAASLQKSKYRLQASLNYNVPFTGSSIGASVSESTSWGSSTISKSLALFFRQSLLSSLNLNVQVNHDLATGDNVASLMLNYFPRTQDESNILNNNNFSYQANYNDKTHVDTQVWQTQKQGSIGEGYNYSAALQRQDRNLSGTVRYQYQDNNGIYTANYAQNEQTIRGNVSVAGSLITANNEVYFGRPITDSFAIVKVKGTEEDIPIYSNGARLGWGNDDKVVVIPNLPSRQVGKMSIKPEDMGLAVVADHAEQSVDVGVRTASVVEFNLSQFVAAEGNAYTLDKEGSKQYLEALPLEYVANGKPQDSFIAKKGFFYLENVPTGEFKATVKRYKHDCTLHLTIPKSDKVVVKLGDILCE
jgi:outer membrane usher protein